MLAVIAGAVGLRQEWIRRRSPKPAPEPGPVVEEVSA
jgi:hypothetical protein